MTNLIPFLAYLVMVGYVLGLAHAQIWNKNNKFTKLVGYNAILGKEEYRIEDYYG